MTKETEKKVADEITAKDVQRNKELGDKMDAISKIVYSITGIDISSSKPDVYIHAILSTLNTLIDNKCKCPSEEIK